MPVTESVKSSEAEKHKHLNREVRDMVSSITGRLSNIHKVGPGHGHDEEEDDDDNGVRIVTLAGTNTGATFQGEVEESGKAGSDKAVAGEAEALKTYVNSNFQAVNNSIMMGGTYNTNDPGVHVEITDDLVDPKGFEIGKKVSSKKGKKKKNNKSDGTSTYSSTSSSTSGSESSD